MQGIGFGPRLTALQGFETLADDTDETDLPSYVRRRKKRKHHDQDDDVLLFLL